MNVKGTFHYFCLFLTNKRLGLFSLCDDYPEHSYSACHGTHAFTREGRALEIVQIANASNFDLETKCVINHY